MPAEFNDLVAQRIAAAVPSLIKISSEYGDMPDPLFLTDNNEEVVYNGDTYLPCFMQVEPPQNSESNDGTATITIGNVDQSIIGALRTILNPLLFEITATLYKIRDENGNVIDPPLISELDYFAGELQDITCDARTIKATIGNRNVLAYALSYTGNNLRNPALS